MLCENRKLVLLLYWTLRLHKRIIKYCCLFCQGDSWNGLTILNPFNYPDVTISVVVEGVQSLQLSEPRYPLEIASDLYQVKNDFTSILGQVVFDENDVYSGDIQEKLTLQKLDNKDVAVLEFLKDVGVLMDLKQKVVFLILKWKYNSRPFSSSSSN